MLAAAFGGRTLNADDASRLCTHPLPIGRSNRQETGPMSHILRRPGVDDDVYFLALYLLEQSEEAAR